MGCWLLPGVAAALNLSLKPPAPQLLEPQHKFQNFLKHMALMIFDQKIIWRMWLRRLQAPVDLGSRLHKIFARFWGGWFALSNGKVPYKLYVFHKSGCGIYCWSEIILLSQNTSPPSQWYVICLVSNGPLVIYNVCFHKRKEVLESKVRRDVFAHLKMKKEKDWLYLSDQPWPLLTELYGKYFTWLSFIQTFPLSDTGCFLRDKIREEMLKNPPQFMDE